MTDGIELNCGQNEITAVPSSESENEQVVIKVESPPKGFVLFDLDRKTSVRPKGFVCFDVLDRWIFDLCYSTFRIEIEDTRSKEDTKLSKQKSKRTWSDQSLALLITVMGFFAGASYMVLFSFHDAFPITAAFKGVVNLSVLELLTFPRAATDDFLVITTVTTTFILSMGMNTIAVCIFFRKFIRGSFLSALSLLTIAAFSLSFFAMLSKFVPHHITIAGGNLKIPATLIVIFYDIYVIILVCAFAYAVQWWRSSRRKQDAVVERKSVV